MLIAFALLAAFIFAVLFGSRRIRTVALQIAASIALAGILVAAGVGVLLVAHH